jgi:hypothetical protein
VGVVVVMAVSKAEKISREKYTGLPAALDDVSDDGGGGRKSGFVSV